NRLNGQTHGVTDAVGKNLLVLAFRGILKNQRATSLDFFFLLVRVGLRPDGDKHSLTVLREYDVTRPMAAATQLAATINAGNNFFFFRRSLQVTGFIRKPYYRV